MGILRRVKMSVEDYLKLPKMAARDAQTGKELPDPVPIAPPIGWYKQPSMFDQVRNMVRSEHLRMYAEAQGEETFEEASDFDVEDDIFPASQYEDQADFEPLQDLQARRQKAFREEFLRERDERYMKRKRREWSAEDNEAARPPEPRPSPQPGAGSGDQAPPPGERSAS